MMLFYQIQRGFDARSRLEPMPGNEIAASELHYHFTTPSAVISTSRKKSIR